MQSLLLENCLRTLLIVFRTEAFAIGPETILIDNSMT